MLSLYQIYSISSLPFLWYFTTSLQLSACLLKFWTSFSVLFFLQAFSPGGEGCFFVCAQKRERLQMHIRDQPLSEAHMILEQSPQPQISCRQVIYFQYLLPERLFHQLIYTSRFIPVSPNPMKLLVTFLINTKEFQFMFQCWSLTCKNSLSP